MFLLSLCFSPVEEYRSTTEDPTGSGIRTSFGFQNYIPFSFVVGNNHSRTTRSVPLEYGLWTKSPCCKYFSVSDETYSRLKIP